ncbi:MAG: penicillin-binding protein 2 [Anaerolineae bacterium]|nr:penicillin-binding protein 2 [Anaerolineae bacterium]
MRDAPVTAVDAPPHVQRDLIPHRRMAFAQAALLGMALLIVAQFVRWQVIQRRELLKDMVSAQPNMRKVPAYRGMILDRNEKLLALNNYDYTIEAAPLMIDELDKADVAEQVAAKLGWPTEQVLDRIAGEAPYAQIARLVPRAVGKEIIALDLTGIFVKPVAVRVYPEHALAAHVLGFVAGDEDEGSKGYYGVEGFYDELLKGKTGERDDRRYPFEPVSFADRRASDWTIPEDGRTVVLTIDRTVQYMIERELQVACERYSAEGGTILVVDPRTGALLASASYPDYDPNQFASTDDALFLDPAVGGQYEPGSTFKIVTMAAALDLGIVGPDDLYNDTGVIEVGGRVIRNWDERAYGLVTMRDVLIHSLNTGMAHVSTVLGPERFYQYVNRFGFGQRTGIDLQGETGGTMRQPGDADWHESDLGTNAFGQGIAVTPIQLTMAVAAVANHGVMMRPYVVGSLIQDDGAIQAKHMSRGQVIRPETAQVLTEMLVQVVDEGVHNAQVPGYRIAGKTGTAQTWIASGYDPELTIASFVGFAPADDPQFVVLVKLDKPKASSLGAATAAPTFANVARILFTQLEIPPDAVRHEVN